MLAELIFRYIMYIKTDIMYQTVDIIKLFSFNKTNFESGYLGAVSLTLFIS